MWRNYWLPSAALIAVGLTCYLRYGGAPPPQDGEPAMPGGVGEAEERALYLTPGGLYTEADIRANGGTTASEKFRGFRAEHDFRPRPGDRICPITRTKANRACTWVVGGETYSFCCPPCVDEFVRLAKEQPERIEAPDSYVRE